MHDDNTIISRLLAGDAEVIARIRSWIRLAFGPYRVRLAADLEDLEQEILLELTAALRNRTFRGDSRLRTYVRTYVHHKSVDRIRALGRRQWVDVEDLDLPSRAPSPLDRLSRSETAELAQRVVEQMPESCRELWRMLEQGMRYKEMSRRVGIREGTLRARMLRCRRQAIELRSRLSAAEPRNENGDSTTK